MDSPVITGATGVPSAAARMPPPHDNDITVVHKFVNCGPLTETIVNRTVAAAR